LDSDTTVTSLALAYTAYLIATVSPGPANMAIVATALRDGRRAGLQLAAGVVLGSLTWGSLAALGLSALLLQYAGLTEVLRLAGGGYLLWLAFNALRRALQDAAAAPPPRAAGATGLAYFSKGLAIHLTNPKSVFAWVAIIAIGVTPDSPAWTAFAIVGGCWLMGMVIFGGCALVFSTPRMADAYGRFRRVIEGVTALVFGLAGIRLLLGGR
jgi:threonine/homoserine/homoserine lactone efflux protein